MLFCHAKFFKMNIFFWKTMFFCYIFLCVCVCLRSTWRHLKNQILRMMMILSDHQLQDQWVQHPYGPQSQRNHYDLEDHLEKSYARIRLVLSILQGQLEFWGNFLAEMGKNKRIQLVQCSAHVIWQVQNATPISVKVNVLQDPKACDLSQKLEIYCVKEVDIFLQSD